jgi:hypothetical protein
MVQNTTVQFFNLPFLFIYNQLIKIFMKELERFPFLQPILFLFEYLDDYEQLVPIFE